MSGGEPSSIKRNTMCREGAGPEGMPAECSPLDRSGMGMCGHALSFYRGEMHMYQALYRKWRPKTFSEVIGQKHITETL